jgi:ABC-type lipopolysaccharide export system ATPase subunit
MPPEIAKRIALLPEMSKRQLIELWNELFKVPAPRQLRRNLLIRFVAYKIQEQAQGGLSRETRSRLVELARKLATNPNAELSGALRIKPP